MGCAASTAPPVEEVEQAAEYQTPAVDVEDLKFDLARAEAQAAECGPESHTFLASVLKARSGHDDDAAIMEDCCTRLQAHNGKLKSLIATADAEAVHEAMADGGFMGWGINHKKLIAVLCSRAKPQLEETKKRYRSMYDLDIRDDVKKDTSGYYGKMVYYSMASEREFIADMIDLACKGTLFDGCDETILVELFVMCEQEQLKAGKIAWEGRSDSSLIDHLNSKLASGYKHLLKLLLELLKGDLNNEDMEADDEVIAGQVEKIHEEVSKSGGMFGAFGDESVDVLIDAIASNNTAQNCRLAELFENTHNMSLAKAITEKCKAKIGWCLSALLLPRPDFVASRIKKALEGWSTDKMTLVRLLGGLDGRKMLGVLESYETKYGLPLASSLTQEVEGNFAKAALTWIVALDDPSGGTSEITEAEPSSHGGDAAKLSGMCDFLLLEYEMLMRFAASLDMETLVEAVKGRKTDDTLLIRTITTRSKRFLGRISYLYRESYGANLSILVDENCDGWYAYLAKFLVLQPSQSDALLLDLALEGAEKGDKESVDTNALIEFLCARHPRRVRAAKKTWEKRNDESLVDRLSDALTGDMRTIALTMLKGKRLNAEEVDEEHADMKQAKVQAKTINSDMAGKAIEILCANSPAQNAAIARVYEETYDSSLGRALGEVFIGSSKAALKALLLEPAQWYAARLKASFKGMGTSDRTVCRIIGAHDKDEIAKIAAAYDDKYGMRLKVAITKHCTGEYRRLAVAWVDLPDQLEQPQKLVELPEKMVEEEATEEAPAEEEEDEFEDDAMDEDVDDLPDPSSTLYKVKLVMWTERLKKAEEAGKVRHIQYYRKLLFMYPPIPSGHKILKEYIEVLEKEYKKGDEGLSDAWIAAMSEETFSDAGTTKEIFDEWQNTSERLVKDKEITLAELKTAWGLNKKSNALPPEPETSGGSLEETDRAVAPPPAATSQGMYGAQRSLARGNTAHNMMANMGQGGHAQAMAGAMQQVTTTVQRTIVHQQPTYQPAQPQMAMQKMAATVPWGHYGGMQMNVNTSQGMMRVTIPPGYGPGSSFTFNVPVRMQPVMQPMMYQQQMMMQRF